MTPTRIRVERILLPPPVPAGLNPLVLMALTHKLKATNEDCEPITVRREGRNYRVTDGRHRFIATVAAGRRRVLARVED